MAMYKNYVYDKAIEVLEVVNNWTDSIKVNDRYMDFNTIKKLTNFDIEDAIFNKIQEFIMDEWTPAEIDDIDYMALQVSIMIDEFEGLVFKKISKQEFIKKAIWYWC